MGTGAFIRTALRWLATAALLAAVALPCAAQTPEHRAMWAFAWGPGFKNSQEVSALVSRTKLSNCNVIVAQVRKEADAYYFPTRPNRDRRAPELAPGYDPLMDLCTQAHEQGIHVYAWVVVERISSPNVTDDSEHLINRHPDWLTKSISGGTLFSTEGYYTDPGHPRAAEWNYNAVMDIIRHYPIDGLVFDYIRYPTANSGYNDVALSRFQERYNPIPAIPYYTDGLWSAWRREQLTHFVRKVYANAIAIKPDIVIGAATIGSRSEAYTDKMQDWRSWMMAGILDCNYPMIYTTSNTTFTSRVGEAVANGGSRLTFALQGSYMNTISNSMTQIGLARTNGAKGIGIYRYCFTHKDDSNSSTDNEPTFYSSLISQPFAQPTGLPAMPWKTDPTVGHVKGVIIDPLRGAGLDAAWISVIPSGGGGGYGTYSDGTGFYAYMNLAPGDYDITVTKGSFVQTKPVTITAGAVRTVDFLASGTSVASITEARQLPDGAGVELPPMTVTAGNNQLLNRFYIEDQNRTSGILVELPDDTDVLAYPGDVVKVYGTLGTTPAGERRIANPIVYTIETDAGEIRPIEIRARDLADTSPNIRQAGADLTKTGLLVETVGRVTAVDTSAECFYVDDGSGLRDGTGFVGLRVKYSGLADGNVITPPDTNTHVRLRGIGSVEDLGGSLHCALVLREHNDISVDPGVTVRAPDDTIRAGWNLLAIPATAFNASPSAVFAGVPLDGKLQGWDARTQGLLIYDEWSPEAFGRIMRGDGYWLRADTSYPLETTAYGGSTCDFLIALPRAGWALIGNPFPSEVVWGDTLVVRGSEVEPLPAAKSKLWLDSMGYWWDNRTQGLCDMGLPEDFPGNTTLRPWHGYWVESYVDNLSLILR